MKISANALGDKTLEMVAERFRILGDPSRLRLLSTLSDREMSVGEVVEATGVPQATVSKQLHILLRAGLVVRRKDGLFVHYRLADPAVLQLCDAVCGSLAAQLQGELDALSEATKGGKGSATGGRKRR